MSVYQAGPDALVAWVEHLLADHAQQLGALSTQQSGLRTET